MDADAIKMLLETHVSAIDERFGRIENDVLRILTRLDAMPQPPPRMSPVTIALTVAGLFVAAGSLALGFWGATINPLRSAMDVLNVRVTAVEIQLAEMKEHGAYIDGVSKDLTALERRVGTIDNRVGRIEERSGHAFKTETPFEAPAASNITKHTD